MSTLKALAKQAEQTKKIIDTKPIAVDTSRKENHYSDEDEHAQLPYKVTISEYEEIAQRLEQSMKQLDLVNDALNSKENLKNLRDRVYRECDDMTLRVQIIKLHSTQNSESKQSVTTNVYKVHIVNMQRTGYLLLKHSKSQKLSLNPGDNYVANKVRLMINTHAEVVLISTSLTVLRQETEETLTPDSIELS